MPYIEWVLFKRRSLYFLIVFTLFPIVSIFADNEFQRLHPGPWGHLESRYIYLEPPDEVVNRIKLDPPIAPWLFKDYSSKQFDDLLERAGLTDSQLAEIRNRSEWLEQIHGFICRPNESLLLSLNPNQRSILYTALSRIKENMMKANPYSFPTNKVDEWLRDVKIPQNIKAEIMSLTYQNGGATLFSDAEIILPKLSSDFEKRSLLKALARRPSLIVKLVMGPEDSIKNLEGYWEPEKTNHNLPPILEAIKRSKDPQVNISFLLPPFARERLYTFPAEDGTERKHDCYWSALNFFNQNADDRYTNPKNIEKAIETEFSEIKDRPSFGDMVIFFDSKDVPIHAAVYIADEIVFTKNGPLESQPWTLESVPDLLTTYSHEIGVKMKYFRQNRLLTSDQPRQ